jgi:hypothetical protein
MSLGVELRRLDIYFSERKWFDFVDSDGKIGGKSSFQTDFGLSLQMICFKAPNYQAKGRGQGTARNFIRDHWI